MEIVFYLGVHLTDEERIQRTLLKNRDALAHEEIVVPWPRHYRYVLRNLQNRLAGEKASRETQDLILDGLTKIDAPQRVVFCNEGFLGLRPQALAKGQLYPMAAERVLALRNLFPDYPVRFFLTLRNLASFIPALFDAVQPSDYDSFMDGTDLARLSWSEMVTRIVAAVPDCPLTVWCNEDLPVLWPEVLRTVSGHAPETQLTHLPELWRELLEPEGLQRMLEYFADHPPSSDARRRRAIAAFLEKFGKADQLEMEIDLPGWTEDMVDDMSRGYEADLSQIARLPGVTLLS